MNDKLRIKKTTGAMAFMSATLLPSVVTLIVLGITAFFVGGKDINAISPLLMTDPFLFASMVLTQMTFIIIAIVSCGGFRYLTDKVSFKSQIKLSDTALSTMLAFGVMLGLAILAVLFMLFLELFGYVPPAETGMPNIDTLPKYLLSIVVVAILPAIGEELLFRGIIFQSLLTYGKKIAVIGSAIAFMLIHASPMQTLYQLAYGVIFGIVILKTGNIFYTMLMHFINNFLAVSMTYFGIGEEFPVIIIMLGIAMLIFALQYFIRQQDKFEIVKEKVLEVKECENETLESFIKMQTRIAKNTDRTTVILNYVIGVAVCLGLWIMQFVQGLA